jgi:hypothetical protein
MEYGRRIVIALRGRRRGWLPLRVRPRSRTVQDLDKGMGLDNRRLRCRLLFCRGRMVCRRVHRMAFHFRIDRIGRSDRMMAQLTQRDGRRRRVGRGRRMSPAGRRTARRMVRLRRGTELRGRAAEARQQHQCPSQRLHLWIAVLSTSRVRTNVQASAKCLATVTPALRLISWCAGTQSPPSGHDDLIKAHE